MATYTVSTEIAAPPEIVFPFLMEPDRLRQWLGGFVSSEPLTEGPVRVGTKSVDVFTEGGREMRMTTEITAFERSRRMEVAIRSPQGEAVSDYRLEGAARTRVTHRQTLQFTGVYRFLAPFIGGVIRRRLAADLARLKQAIEGEPR